VAEFQAPLGQFLLLELEPGLNPGRIADVFCNVTLLDGVRSCSDLASIPIEGLAERVMLRLSPDEQQLWLRDRPRVKERKSKP